MSKAEVCVPTLPKGIKFSQFITAFGLKLVESRQKADREVFESLSFLFQVSYFNTVLGPNNGMVLFLGFEAK